VPVAGVTVKRIVDVIVTNAEPGIANEIKGIK
jgi:hypothetical protein